MIFVSQILLKPYLAAQESRNNLKQDSMQRKAKSSSNWRSINGVLFSTNRMNLVKKTEIEFSIGDELGSSLVDNMIGDIDVDLASLAPVHFEIVDSEI